MAGKKFKTRPAKLISSEEKAEAPTVEELIGAEPIEPIGPPDIFPVDPPEEEDPPKKAKVKVKQKKKKVSVKVKHEYVVTGSTLVLAGVPYTKGAIVPEQHVTKFYLENGHMFRRRVI
jgi:hypothetical protein